MRKTADELLGLVVAAHGDIDLSLALAADQRPGGEFEYRDLSSFKIGNKAQHSVEHCGVWFPAGRMSELFALVSFHVIKPVKNCQFFFFRIPDSRSNVRFSMRGAGSTAVLLTEKKVKLSCKMIEGGNALIVGEDSYIGGAEVVLHKTHLIVGAGGLWSDGILIQGADSHGIVDIDKMKIVNGGPKRITIGKRVWLCRRSTVTKNVSIGDGSVIAAGAIVTGDIPSLCAAGGIPAIVKKRRVTWCQSSKKITDAEKRAIIAMRERIDAEPHLKIVS